MNFKEYVALENDFQSMIALTEREDPFEQHNFAMDTLDKVEKVAAYLIKSKLQKSADVQRFLKFIEMIQKDLPNLAKSAEAIKKDIEKAVHAHYTHYV